MANPTTAERYLPLPDGERDLAGLSLKLGPAAPLEAGLFLREGRSASGARHRVLEFPGEKRPAALTTAFGIPGVATASAQWSAEGRELVALRPRPGPSLEFVLRRKEGLLVWAPALIDSLAALFQRIHDQGLRFRQVATRMFGIDAEGAITLEEPEVLRVTDDQSGARRTSLTAPEVLQGQSADERSDQFALGALAWALLAGRTPPGAGDLPSLRIFRPDLPHGVITAIARATAVDPGARYASCTAFARDLRARTTPRGEASPSLKAGVATEIGRQKKLSMPVNQDTFYVGHDPATRRGMFLVADGVSTADVGSGDLASGFLRDAVKGAWEGAVGEIFRNQKGDVPEEWLRTALEAILEDASARIYAYLKQPIFVGSLNPGVHPPSSTAVLAMLDGDRMLIGNVGDSRTYLLRDGGFEQMSVDQDLRTDLLKAGRDPATLAEAGSLGALTQSVGGFMFQADGAIALRPVKADVFLLHLRGGDRLLLCSDGVPDCLGDEAAEIMPRELAQGDDPEAIAKELCRIADELLGGDNITALVVLA